MRNSNSRIEVFDCIVTGAGASGLFYAAADSFRDPKKTLKEKKVIIEKTSRPGQKLLMSGNGMCNITHAGSIRDFIPHYGENGRSIRSCLYRHNNAELREFMDSLGVPTIERGDGKVFPASMNAKDVLDALLSAAGRGGWELLCGAEVTEIKASDDSDLTTVTLSDGTKLSARKLVIATGGASYPSTGSDGTFLKILERDLGLAVTELKPALTPVYVQDYRYSELSGTGFDAVSATCGKHTTHGPMLITHKGFSGPAILHISQYVKPGDELVINYLPAYDHDSLLQDLKEKQRGNSTGASNYIASEYHLPKAFVSALMEQAVPEVSEKKTSSLTGKELDHIAVSLTRHGYPVSGTGGWNDAMVTRGGVALDQIELKTMRLRNCPDGCDIRIIGETLDVNGDSGGYNLQFAYSSAASATE